MHCLDMCVPRDPEDDEPEPQEIGWKSLMKYYPGTRLLPNLRRFHADYIKLHPFYHLFIQPTLVKLDLENCTVESIQPFIQCAHLCASSLKVLNLEEVYYDLWEAPPPPDIPLGVSRAICSLTALTDVSVGDLRPEALAHLATLPRLKYLSFKMLDAVHVGHPLPAASFQSLGQVRIYTRLEDVSPVAAFLRASTFPQLRSMSLSWDPSVGRDVRNPSARSLALLFDALGDHLGLRSVSISPELVDYAAPESTVHIQHIHGLLRLRDLAELDMSKIPCALTPGDLTDCARACPKMRTLHLGDRVRRMLPRVEVQDLLPFAAHCPALRTLGLCMIIPAKSLGSAIRPPFGWQYRSQLESLDVGGTSVAFSPDVVCFLARVFPRARLHSSDYNTNLTLQQIGGMRDAMVKMLEENVAQAASGQEMIIA